MACFICGFDVASISPMNTIVGIRLWFGGCLGHSCWQLSCFDKYFGCGLYYIRLRKERCCFPTPNPLACSPLLPEWRNFSWRRRSKPPTRSLTPTAKPGSKGTRIWKEPRPLPSLCKMVFYHQFWFCSTNNLIYIYIYIGVVLSTIILYIPSPPW